MSKNSPASHRRPRLTAAALCTLSIGGTLAATSVAYASENPLEEVVVTAQKRAQSVQDVAISMAAYSEQQLRALGINDIGDLAQNAPNVHFASFFEAGKPNISIRGISIGQLFTNFEQAPVGVYYDDVYMGSRSGQLAQMFDQERVEILRGPQGTLFGRNTTAGAINFIAKKPSNEFEADASLTYGRFEEVGIDGGITVPVTDTFSMRFAGVKRERDGWQKNINPQALPGQRELDNIDAWAARALFQWKPTADMTWLLNVHTNRNDSNTPVIHADLGSTGHIEPNTNPETGGYQETGRWDTVSTNDPFKEKLKGEGAALTGTIGFGDLTLTSISAYERTDYFEADDDDATPYRITPINTHDVTKQYSQELRLAAKQGRVDWVAGVYYYEDDLWQVYNTESYTDPIFAGQGRAAILQNTPTQTSENYAGFVDVRYAISDEWTLGVGARYTHESKHFVGAAFLTLPDFGPDIIQTIGFPGDTGAVRDPSWSAPTGRIVLEWKPTDDILTYGSVSRGFKSGGINGLAFNTSEELTPYDPEKIDAYEIGVKSEWADGRLVANAAVFYNKIDDQQALVVDVSGAVPLFFVRNASSGTSKGAELELRAYPDDHWSLSFGLGLLDTEFDGFVLPDGTDYSGQEFTNAPKLSGNALIQYSFDLFGGTLGPHADVSYASRRWFDNPQRPGIDEQSGYAIVDASVPWRSADEKIEVSLWGRNLADKQYYTQTIGNGLASYGSAVSYHSPPRTYGITVRYSFD